MNVDGEDVGCHRLSAPPFVNLDYISLVLCEWILCVKDFYRRVNRTSPRRAASSN
jgi:hypothetical protein